MTAQDLTDRDCLHDAQRGYEFVVSCADDEERAGEGAFLAGPLQQLVGLANLVTMVQPLGGRGRRPNEGGQDVEDDCGKD